MASGIIEASSDKGKEGLCKRRSYRDHRDHDVGDAGRKPCATA